MRNKFFLFLFILFLIQLSFRIYLYRNNYLQKFDAKYWENQYLHSQWMPVPKCVHTDPHINPNTCQWDDSWYEKHKNEKFKPIVRTSIGDDGLYTYAGWAYIHGRDPTTLNAEIPPLGKYVIGFFEVIFGNQNLFALSSGMFVLSTLFILNKIIFKNNLLAFLPVLLFSFDPLFFTQLRAPFLDLFYLGLIILTFIFTLKEKLFLAVIFLGLAMATKASSLTLVVMTTTTVMYFLYMKYYPDLKRFLLFLPLSGGVFLLTYVRFFLLGHNLHEFLSVQKWILAFYQGGAKGDPTAIFQIVLLGRWPNWFGPVQSVPEWNLLWTISFITTMIYCIKILPKRRQFKSVLLAIWILLYIASLVFVPVWPRYLLLVLPFMYNLTVWVFSKNMSGFLRRLL